MLSSIRRQVNPGLIAIYLVAVLLVIVIGVLATVRLNQIRTTVDDLTNNLAYDRALADDIISQVLLMRFYASKYVRTQQQADLDHFNAEFANLRQLLDETRQQISHPARVEMLGHIESAAEEYGTTFQRVAELIREEQRITSETLHVESLSLENDLTALKMHVVSLNNSSAFLAFGNAQNATAQMHLHVSQYLDSGDERYIVLFERSYQQAQSSFSRLEDSLQDPVQRENTAEARQASDAYRAGFQAIRTNQVELASLFTEKLDVLEPEISNTAEAMAASVERDFKSQNAFAKTLISQTRLVLATTTIIATLAGLGLGLVMMRYITEREEAEKALLEAHEKLEQRVRDRTAELRAANEEIKHFAYIVSHDLRAPLVNLKGFSTELRFALEDIQATAGDVIPHLDEQQRETLKYALEEDVPEALSFIESSVTRMDNFINAVLKLSRLGRRELKLESLNMETLVEQNLDTLAHQIEEKQVDVTVGSLPEVTADRTSMEQIVGNILGNAVKYLDADRAAKIEIAAEKREEDIVFSIRDTGRGIAEDDMDKVFAPFRRAGRQDAPGEGMGLAYVQTLVRRHGGRIWCESQFGIGTSFYFTVPLEIASDV